MRRRSSRARPRRLSSGALYLLEDAELLAPAVAAVAARLRGEDGLSTTVVEEPGVRQEESLRLGEAPPAAVAEVAPGERTVAFRTELPARGRYARLVYTWDDPDAFELSGLRFARAGRRPIAITRAQIRRALRTGEWGLGSGGINLRARGGETFVSLELRGLDALGGPSGLRASAADSKKKRAARSKLTKKKAKKAATLRLVGGP